MGLYQVVAVEGEDIQVSRLHSNEDGRLGTTHRLSWLSMAELPMFRVLKNTRPLDKDMS